MNRHQRMERKRARRRRRTAESRGGGRGPVTRGAERARLMNEGEQRIFAMVRSTRTPGVAARMQTKAEKASRAVTEAAIEAALRVGRSR